MQRRSPVSEVRAGQGPQQAPAGQGSDPAPLIAAWRASGADRRDPVRFRFIEALARRSEAHHGETRRVLEARLALALQAFGARVEAADAAGHGAPGRSAAPPAAAGGLLAGLVRDLRREMAPDTGPAPAGPVQTRPARAVAGGAGGGPAVSGELAALRYFRNTWARLSADQRLSQSRATVPGNAGPLNSEALVLRALTLMREISPEYLGHFMAHVDALQWLEQAQGGSVPPEAPRADTDKPRKSGRGKPG